MSATPLALTDLKGHLPLVARGKVRDLYAVNDNQLLFVATDRISAYDVIMTNGIPEKGKILTSISKFWFQLLANEIKNHVAESENSQILAALPKAVQDDPELVNMLKDRCLLVNKYKIVPIEAIVRGYITGSAWSEYKKSGTVHGMSIEAGLQESQKLPQAIYTPSTKAEQGEHDENISVAKAAEIIGDKNLADEIEKLSVQLYTKAAEFASKHGIIIADTKFEFGIDENGKLVLVDEVLTPDSSRFWNAKTYEVGKGQDSYDKQYLRNWLTNSGLKGQDGVAMTPQVVSETREKYIEAYQSITGCKWCTQ